MLGLMRTCIAATRKVSHVFIYTYKLKVSGAHAPLGPTVDTPLNNSEAYNLLPMMQYISAHKLSDRIWETCIVHISDFAH